MTDRSIFYAGLTLAERFKDLSTRTMWHHQMQEISVSDSTELRNCSTGTKLFQSHLSPVIHEQFGALLCTVSFPFTLTFKTLEK